MWSSKRQAGPAGLVLLALNQITVLQAVGRAHKPFASVRSLDILMLGGLFEVAVPCPQRKLIPELVEFVGPLAGDAKTLALGLIYSNMPVFGSTLANLMPGTSNMLLHKVLDAVGLELWQLNDLPLRPRLGNTDPTPKRHPLAEGAQWQQGQVRLPHSKIRNGFLAIVFIIHVIFILCILLCIVSLLNGLKRLRWLRSFLIVPTQVSLNRVLHVFPVELALLKHLVASCTLRGLVWQKLQLQSLEPPISAFVDLLCGSQPASGARTTSKTIWIILPHPSDHTPPFVITTRSLEQHSWIQNVTPLPIPFVTLNLPPLPSVPRLEGRPRQFNLPQVASDCLEFLFSRLRALFAASSAMGCPPHFRTVDILIWIKLKSVFLCLIWLWLDRGLCGFQDGLLCLGLTKRSRSTCVDSLGKWLLPIWSRRILVWDGPLVGILRRSAWFIHCCKHISNDFWW